MRPNNICSCIKKSGIETYSQLITYSSHSAAQSFLMTKYFVLPDSSKY